MDSDSSEASSTDYTSESSDDDDGMETAEINGSAIQLPQGLCDKKDIFDSVLSTGTWNSLTDKTKQYLQTFLPTFPDNDLAEKNRTLQKLFRGETFKFVNPLTKFHDDLKAGYYRPDIANMRRMIVRAERKEATYRYKKLRQKLKQDVMESQTKLLDQIRNLPPGVEPKLQRNHQHELDYVVHRTKRRYYQVLTSIQTKIDDGYCSPDENYPEGAPVPLSRKQRRHLTSINNSNIGDIYYSTMSTKSTGLDLEKYVTPSKNPFYMTDDSYKTLLVQHKRRKLNKDDPEMNTKGMTLNDIIERTQLPYVKNLTVQSAIVSKNNNKKRTRKEEIYNTDHESDSDSIIVDAVTSTSVNHVTKSKTKAKVGTIAKPRCKPNETKMAAVVVVDDVVTTTPLATVTTPPPPPPSSVTIATNPVTMGDLDGIDMMNLPIDLDNSDIDISGLNKPELMQETHANFLSLIRDIVCSTSEHRMSLTCLEQRLKSWQENPISPLNDWYNLSDNWLVLLKSAVEFLCGNYGDQPDDFVPYMEHKAALDVYQWIGAGRDCDSLLSPLYSHWLEHKSGNSVTIATLPTTCTTNVHVAKKDVTVDVDVSDRSQTPPPPRFPTNWTVRKATCDEIKEFRHQERKRYDHPHKAFTYRCYGYESVVGPLKGIYNPSVGNNSKARGHTMLNADRPNFVTILSLVRDATARLPNGEGTRTEICELLKSSQYISSTAPDNVLQTVVSGALDRMHTQFDPCVKYDSKRKIWIYLHRNRSEEDFERIHQQYQGVNKGKKAAVAATAATTPKKTTQKAKVTRKLSTINSGDNQTSTTPPPPPPTPILIQRQSTAEQLTDQKEINEALQAIVVNKTQPTTNTSAVVNLNKKSLVKIISPGQGKSLIIPATVATSSGGSKQSVATQQYIQHKMVQKQQAETSIVLKDKPQIIQSITPQQLSNMKNVTLVRNVTNQATTSSSDQMPKLHHHHHHHHHRHHHHQEAQQIQIKTQSALTVAQQQHILQTLKQKILPQGGGVIATTHQQGGQNQQIVIKQKTGQVITKQNTSLLGQLKSDSTNKTTQSPVVAKVLTNAAGQVISVESLLAHQKQHGSLPQGTTLRVSSTKGGQPNIIQLTSGMTSQQNNIITIGGGQPKLVMTSSPHQPPPINSNVSRVAMVNKTHGGVTTTTKLNPKVAQQLINAKVITAAQLSGDNNKIVTSPKIFVSQASNHHHVRLTGRNTTAANTIRMVNATNLNLTHIAGKPVLLAAAGKGGAIQNIQGQNLILQTQSHGTATGGGGLVLQSAVKSTATTTAGGGATVNIINQLKLPQHHQQVIFKNQNATVSSPGQQIVLEGQPIRLQTTTANTSQQRVVLASQGQGGQIVAQQILLPAGFQGTAINIKALQGIKVIPLAQAHGQVRGSVQSRQVFARVMSPSVVKTATVTLPTQQLTDKPPDPPPQQTEQ